MFSLIKRLFGWFQETVRFESQMKVSFDKEYISYEKPDTGINSIKWSEVEVILIKTTDEGPFVCDVFFVLLAKDLKSGCYIPQDATGCDILFEELQNRFDGFDNEKVIQAMSSTENNTFLIWKKPSQ